MTLYTFQNLTYLLLSLVSLGSIGLFLYLCLRQRSQLCRWHYLFPILAVVILAWSIRMLCKHSVIPIFFDIFYCLTFAV